ncbi:glycerate kinase [Accumulibacter sp.]|uniref:glycerate kinase n=1 Tax=Accumulibacter sp. TaxID=2053492 RepID=UPI0025E69BD1|nr:glycerate kinase [Accumulibacter sp.]MCM8614218.1 glycerate kinase [Accumulibacter sp.]MCM8638013.1 glycerate kinase [Accumulibacter sp.]MCM8641343.1 glycerate kinase [Accumulibacter sp.]
MHIVVAPDSFKGSLPASDVAVAMERGIRLVFPAADVRLVPIADGGEGTVAALVAATGGTLRQTRVSGPLHEPVLAQWGVLGDGRTAVIEMAAASGLTLLPPAQRDPCRTTSFGTGELIRAALDCGLRRIIVGLGGSATNDGGAGMARALGARFSDEAGRELPDGGAALARLERVDIAGLDRRLQETGIIVACDVDNPLCGPRGASATFAPQKGASATAVGALDSALARYAGHVRRATGRDVGGLPGAGAAGGLGAGLLFFTPAKLRPGVDIVLEAVGFAEIVRHADFVVTGEGRTDFQTAFGKAPIGVARLARRFGVPVFCVSGALGEGADDVLEQGIDATMSICERPMPLDECMRTAGPLIESATARLCRIIRASRQGRGCA